MPKKRIFISSVQKEFAEERKRLFDYLMDDPILSKFFVPFIFEDYPATGRSTSTVYLKEVEKSDIYLGIFGDEYGFQNKAGLSPTEQEYNLAHKLHKDCLIYIKRDSSKRQAKEKTFIQKVEADVVRRTFDNYEELKAAVYKSLALYLEEKELFRLVPFDQAKDNEATIKDISDDKIKSFIELSKQKRNFKFKENISATDLLTHLSLMDESGHLTNAAILLFGKKPQRFFISSEVKCMQFYGNEIEKPIPSLQIYKGDIFQLVDQATSFVMSRINMWIGTRAKSASVPTKPELPGEAVREAIVNAICHRDYTSNASVQVMLFKNRLEIWNPGQLPYELTTQQLYKPHKSHPNNPLIAKPLQRSGFIEKAGTGTGEIVKLCLQHGLKKPLFEQDGDFKVIIWRPGTQDGTQNGTQDGTQKQLEEKIISLIKANPKISRKDIATATQTSPRTIARRIKEMNDKIRFVGSGYSGHWEVIGSLD